MGGEGIIGGSEIMSKFKEYPEAHQTGTISIENMPDELECDPGYVEGDFGIQISKDGRVWICVNGIAFIRFSPHPNGKMQK